MTDVVVRFYRMKGTMFVRVAALARSSGRGYRSSESWRPASGKFTDTLDATGGAGLGAYEDTYRDVYQSDYVPSTEDVTAMYHAAALWRRWMWVPIEYGDGFSSAFADALVLYEDVNWILNWEGYTRPDGGTIV